MADIVIFDNLPGSDSSWDKWRQMIIEEGWTDNEDQSVDELMPILPTTRSVVAKDKEGNTLCHLMWSEYFGLSFVHTFLTDKEYRGYGIGKKVWRRAMDRIDGENTTMMLKSVPELVDFYKKEGFIVEGPKNYSYCAPWQAYIDIFEKSAEKIENCIQTITPELFDKWVQFDRMVTGRDRKSYLEKYFALDYTHMLCILDENGDISGTISIVPSPNNEKVLYKVSTLYTSSTEDAAALLFRAAQIISELNSEANIGFFGLEGSRGLAEFDEILSNHPQVTKDYICILLTSKPYKNPVDLTKLFISSNSDCSFDA